MCLAPTVLFAVLCVAAGTVKAADPAVMLAPQINAADFAQFDKTLSSDEFGGRKPGTAAEPRTTGWLVQQFRRMGLEPGNHGSWFQSVPAHSAPSVKRVNSMRRRTVLQQNKPYPFAAHAIRMRRKG